MDFHEGDQPQRVQQRQILDRDHEVIGGLAPQMDVPSGMAFWIAGIEVQVGEVLLDHAGKAFRSDSGSIGMREVGEAVVFQGVDVGG